MQILINFIQHSRSWKTRSFSATQEILHFLQSEVLLEWLEQPSQFPFSWTTWNLTARDIMQQLCKTLAS